MKIFITLLIIFAILIVCYATFGRNWLKAQSWTAGFFAFIEPIEIALWKKSETILWARLQMLIGVLLTYLTQVGTIDITPLLPFIPDKYSAYVQALWNMLPMTITLLGVISEKLRRDVTKPLDVVALPDVLPPKVAEAVAMADQTNKEAVAVAKVAVADGSVAAAKAA